MRPGGDEVTVYVEDNSGGCVCEDCGYGACIHTSWVCTAQHCQCQCRGGGDEPEPARADFDVEWDRQVEQRAAELDDRPRAALESVARDMQAEARPDLAALLAERYGTEPPAEPDTGVPPCGTYAAYQRHKRKGEPSDDACREANRRYSAERRASSPAARGYDRQYNQARAGALEELGRKHSAEFHRLLDRYRQRVV
jgi:hypothetical protein